MEIEGVKDKGQSKEGGLEGASKDDGDGIKDVIFFFHFVHPFICLFVYCHRCGCSAIPNRAFRRCFELLSPASLLMAFNKSPLLSGSRDKVE